jgi:hypothetical protein
VTEHGALISAAQSFAADMSRWGANEMVLFLERLQLRQEPLKELDAAKWAAILVKLNGSYAFKASANAEILCVQRAARCGKEACKPKDEFSRLPPVRLRVRV